MLHIKFLHTTLSVTAIMTTWYNTSLTMTDTKAIVYHLLLWGKPAGYNVWLHVSEGHKMKAFCY